MTYELNIIIKSSERETCGSSKAQCLNRGGKEKVTHHIVVSIGGRNLFHNFIYFLLRS